MPEHFVCRLIVTQEGNRVRYGPFDADGVVDVVTLEGPSMAAPPEHPLTETEFNAWTIKVTRQDGFTYSKGAVFQNAPLVEATWHLTQA